MVYDPSASSRSATGVFPRGFPFTSTSASAGVDRINMLPVGARSTAPDAGRDGVGAGARVPGAMGATGAGCGLARPRARRSRRGAGEIDNCGVNARGRLRHGSRSPPAQEPSDRQRRDDRDGENRNGDRPLPAARLWFGGVCRVELLRRLRRPRAIQRMRR